MAGLTQKSKNPGEDNMQKVDLTTLTLPQLSQLKQQLEQVGKKILMTWKLANFNHYICFVQDLNLYQESLQTLKIAQTKFQESAESAEKLETTPDGADILVPLTGSVRFYLFKFNLNSPVLILFYISTLDVCAWENK